MNIIRTLKVFSAGLSAIVAVTAYGESDTRPPYEGVAAEAIVDDEGNMHVPADYQVTYQMLGSWAVAADDGPGSKELHIVYASPGSIAAYREDGHFPDGTVLVKEVFNTATTGMTTGTVSSADALVGWFIMVKDNVGRFPENKLWGEGWGWAWFDEADSTTTTSTDYKTDCQTCHLPVKESDWLYIDGYPPLDQ